MAEGQAALSDVQRNLENERQTLASRQHDLMQRESGIKGAHKSLLANRDGLSSQLVLMTQKLERLMSDRTELDARRERTMQDLESAGADDVPARLELALEELKFERRARKIEREQLAAMANQFSHVREQLTGEQARFVNALNDLANRDLAALEVQGLDDSAEHFSLGDLDAASDDERALFNQVADVESEIESLGDEQADIKQKLEETERRLDDLDGADPNDDDLSDSGSDDSDEKENAAVSVEELTKAAKQSANDAAGQTKAFRSMLASVFGIRKKKKSIKKSDDSNAQSAKESASQDKVIEESLAESDDESGSDEVETEDGDVQPNDASASEPTDETADETADETLAIDEPDQEEPEWAKEVVPDGPEVDRVRAETVEDEPDPEEHRRRKNRELAGRMAMTSLREVANQSARNALAEHTQRKFRRKMWVDGTLACIAMGLGGTYLRRDFDQPISWDIYGWVAIVVGVIAAVEMLRTFVRWQRVSSMRRACNRKKESADNQNRYDRLIRERQDMLNPTVGFSRHSHEHEHDSLKDKTRRTRNVEVL
jgi:hypothetical protein